MNESLPSYFLKRSTRSRHIRLQVLPGGRVVVSAPRGVSEFTINSFLASHDSWLRDKVEHFKKIPEPKFSIKEEKKIFTEHKNSALVLAEKKVKEWSQHYNFPFNKICVRNSRSRWGSCSSKGTLCFNYKIVFLPKHLADYLVVHELCHLKERNHSKNFWALVEEKIPDYETRRKELRQFEPTVGKDAF